MLPIKTTALEQKLSLPKAGVTGELRAAPCREGAASHGSRTKERLFSLTSALRENSLEIVPDTPKREFSEPGKLETMLCNSSLSRTFLSVAEMICKEEAAGDGLGGSDPL